ncbi:MAG: hypothetical protein AAFR55_07460 [Pseudomonadota bacterium]
MVDWGNAFIVLLALPTALVGYFIGRAVTYWIDIRWLTFLTIVFAGFTAILPAFLSWLLVEAISPVSLFLPLTAAVAGFFFGMMLGAWQTRDRGGWRNAGRAPRS